MITVYIDSTLKNEWNVEFNLKLCNELENRGIQCHLPQRNTDQAASKEQIYKHNIAAIEKSDVVLAVANNESPNWGVEVGYATAKGIRVVGLASREHDIPVMARFMLKDTLMVHDLDEITDYIDELIVKLS